MFKENTEKFIEWAQTTMSNLIGKTEPVIEEFDDVTTMEYQLPRAMNVDDVMNIFEDDMDLTIIYCAKRSEENAPAHVSAVTKPVGMYMFKFNCASDVNGNVTSVSVVIYDSVENMADEVLADIRNLEENDFIFEHKIADGMLTALFCE